MQLATPWKHKDSGVFYLYRQIPAPLRPAFGGRQFEKKSLKTKDPDEARRLYAAANAAFELQLEGARTALAEAVPAIMTESMANAAIMASVESYRPHPHPLLTSLWSFETAVASLLNLPQTLLVPRDDMLRDMPLIERRTMSLPGDVWLAATQTCTQAELMRLFQPEADDIIAKFGKPTNPTPDNRAMLMAVFSKLVAEENLRLRTAVMTPRREDKTRARPQMSLGELFEEWKVGNKPRKQTINEYEGYVADLINYLGDVPAAAVTKDAVHDYRDEAIKIHKSLPKAVLALPFCERVAYCQDLESRATKDAVKNPEQPEKVFEKVSAGTLKKRIGGIAALLGYAAKQLWIVGNVASGVPISGYSRTATTIRPFQRSEYSRLFLSPLFTVPKNWKMNRAVTDRTLFWLFLIGGTTGARIEEIGKALLSEIEQDNGILYIDVDGAVKTEGSKRLVPIHDALIRIGFDRYIAVLRAKGETQLFPELSLNQFDKMTKEASRTAGRYIDKIVSPDPSLVFHSTRHSFKDLADNAEIPEKISDKISGHAPATVGRRYGSSDIELLHRHLMRLDLSFIDWDRLERVFASFKWR